MEKILVVHYDEIGLKGKNRSFFESALVSDLKKRLKKSSVKNEWGRIIIYNPEEKAQEKLLFTPGVSSFGVGASFAKEDFEKVKQFAIDIVAYEENPGSFAVRAKRVDKNFPKTSQEVEREVGEAVFEHYKRELPVKLKKPDLLIFIEILHDKILIYKKQKGLGGLPSGVSGKAISLISGGFDSPVATYKMILRGVTPLAVHFHGMPKTPKEAIEKVKELLKILSLYSGELRLFLVPTLNAMQTIAKSAPEKLRLILLRRFMMMVAEEIAKKEGAQAIITGESVGQVASQTLENLRAIEQATSLPVLRPLSGSSKHEIIELSQKLGMYDISAQDCEDTCSLFVPKHPETKAKLNEVLKAEKSYSLQELIQEALLQTEELIIKNENF